MSSAIHGCRTILRSSARSHQLRGMPASGRGVAAVSRRMTSVDSRVPAARRTTRHRRRPRRAGRQDRAEPADGAGAGAAGAGDLPGVVRGLRAGEGQGRRRDRLPLHAPARLRRPAHPLRRFRHRPRAGGVGGEGVSSVDAPSYDWRQSPPPRSTSNGRRMSVDVIDGVPTAHGFRFPNSDARERYPQCAETA